MSNKYLDTQIIYHGDDNQLIVGETVICEFIFTPKVNLHIMSMGFYLLKEDGTFSYFKKINKTQVFTKNKTLKKGKTYRYESQLTGTLPISFKGKITNISWEIKTFVKLTPSSFLKIRNDYLSERGLSHLLNDTKDLLSTKFPINVVPSKLPLIIHNEDEDLTASYFYLARNFLLALIATLAFSLYFSTPKNKQTLAFAGVALLFVLASHFFKKSILNTLQIQTKSLNNKQFIVALNLAKNKKLIRKVKVQYIVKEKTILFPDNPEPETAEATIYKSPVIQKSKISQQPIDILDFPEIAYDFTFDFPKEKIPSTFNSPHIVYYWKIYVTVYFFFILKSEFSQKIVAKRTK